MASPPSAGGARPCRILLAGRTVRCNEQDVGRYGRMIGGCLVGDLDINEWARSPRLGFGVPAIPRDYVAAEDEVRATGRGMWAGTFEPPWEWRRRRQ